MERLVLHRDTAGSPRSVQSSNSNELPTSQTSVARLPTSERRMSGQGLGPRERVKCPKCGSRVQRQYMKKHDKTCIKGDDAGSMCARTAQRTNPKLIPPFKDRQQSMWAGFVFL